MQWGVGGAGITEAVKMLLIANGIGFLLQMLIGAPMLYYLGLIPRLAWSRFFIWQFATYMFLHGGFFHILINMYALWVFGCEVERMWGSKAFYKYYFITGIGAGIIHTLLTPMSTIPTIGASGAVLGVLTAFAMMFPDRQITLLLFFILPVTMKARTLALLFAGMSVFSGVFGSADGVAHFAHLGGMLVGFLYMKRGGSLGFLLKPFKDWTQKRRMRVHREKEENKEKIRRAVDKILDKANDVGMENLSNEEKQFLKKASKILGRDFK
jgi:membrane associated rhomboid family serine protease